MAIFKSATPVHCRYCGKGIRKWTTTVYIKDAPSKYDGQHSYCRYVYVGAAKLKNKAECQRHSNHQVVSLKYSHPTQDGDRIPGASYVCSFAEWDGESWHDPYFCGAKCAEGMAYSILAIQPAWGTEAYRKAKSRL